MKEKIHRLLSNLEKVESELGDPLVLSDKKKYRSLAAEHKYLMQIKEHWDAFEKCSRSLQEDRELSKMETDPELLQMLSEEVILLEENRNKLESRLHTLLVPPDPNDSKNCIIELRAGTGGDEAAIFVGDCLRMYHYYAEKMGWQVEELSCTPSESGGYKEYLFVLAGENVYRFMKYEAGTHRVQRVPDTETQGRVHTSAITVAVIIEPDEEEKVEINEKDLKIDTYRSSGAGGQHVNTTDSAVRITHLPTGIVVHCQDERSQIKNREKGMRILKARVAEEKRRRQHEEISSMRAAQIGSGDRSEKIRTYNFPQNRVTDHRINLTLYNLTEVMKGALAELSEALVSHYYQKNFDV
jgi:peptide chain release factor 1